MASGTRPKRLWAYLALGGILEVGWAIALGYSDGFTKPEYVPPIVAFMASSMYLLGIAIDGGLPTGTAYAVWVGIGAVGTFAVSALLGNETLGLAKLLCIAAIIGGVVGLQATGGGAVPSDRG